MEGNYRRNVGENFMRKELLKKDIRRKWLRSALLLLALIFIGVGIARGENDTVLLKAINICMECIGIG